MITEQETIDALLAKLYNICGGAIDTVNNVPAEPSYVSFIKPGVPLTPESLSFGFTAMSSASNSYAADFSDFVNAIPSFRGFWNDTGRRVHDEYFRIIDQPVLPVSQLSAQEEEQLKRARQFLFREDQYQDVLTGDTQTIQVDSLLYERYKLKAQAYDAARVKYNAAFEEYITKKDDITAGEIWARKAPFLRDILKRAYNDWVASGKEKVEQVIALIDSLERRGADRVWQDRRERYNNYVRDDLEGGDYILTKYFPDKFWTADNAGTWTTFGFSHKEIHATDTSSKTNWGGGGGFGFGLFSFGASVNRESVDSYSKCDVSGLEISFDIAKIPLRRTWLDASVFASRAWKFNPQIVSADEATISDGNVPPSGTMIALPTAMIVVRNVKLTLDASSEVNQFSFSKISTSGRAGWGPFSLRGNYAKESSNNQYDFAFDGGTIVVPNMQTIGFVCQLLPRCPNPDLNLNWPA